jgi:hypothetical protein
MGSPVSRVTFCWQAMKMVGHLGDLYLTFNGV